MPFTRSISPVLPSCTNSRNDGGMKTRKETIGATGRNAANGMLTIRFNGVQVINNKIVHHLVAWTAIPNPPA